ncbi:MAG: sulfotransferase [Halieaceae bacterium]|jgi:hypothetical protein|nr:sulfotransferase [Halieaceae bacterium]
MQDQSNTLPLPIRVFNNCFAILGSFGNKLISLEPAPLMQKASQNTGLSDYGSDYFRAPLELLCDSLEQDAQLSALGRVMARGEILRLLSNRLQFVDLFKQHPQIAEQQVIAPLFILGMPRTGTTSMHELVALDPQFRVPLSWEVAYPFPPPQRETYETDPRIARVDNDLRKIDNLLPDFRNMHPMGATLPQECVALFSHDFVSMIFDVQFCLDRYQAWLIKEDMAEVFKNHRRWLQLLQWKFPAKTWVLKSPQYLWNIEDMVREYPDARVIQTHRDPIKVALSIGNLTATLRTLGSSHVDLKKATRSYADLLHYGTVKTMEARDKHLLGDDRIIDVQFAEFRKSPVVALRRIYDFFDLSLSSETATRMQQFLDGGEESERHGKHSYNLDDSGLNLEEQRQRFRPYQETFNIPSEKL